MALGEDAVARGVALLDQVVRRGDEVGEGVLLLEQLAVNSVSNPKILVIRLDVDVGSAFSYRVVDEIVDELDYRRALGGGFDVGNVVLGPAVFVDFVDEDDVDIVYIIGLSIDFEF